MKKRSNSLVKAVFGSACAIGILLCAAAALADANSCDLQPWELHQNLTTGYTAWNSNTTIVTLQNLSKYDMELTGDGGLRDLIGKYDSGLAAAFLPTGYPAKLKKSCYQDDPSCGSVSASPLAPMVVAFYDGQDNARRIFSPVALTYSLKNVCNDDKKCGDVPFYLTLTRCEPPAPKVGVFKQLMDIAKEAMALLKVSLSPESPMAWIKLISTTYSLAKDADFPDKNTQKLRSTIKVSAYAVSPQAGQTCSPATQKGASSQDAVATQAGRFCYPSDDIVVQINVYRGNFGKGDGYDQIPITHVMVYDYHHWVSANFAAALHSPQAKPLLTASPVTAKLAAQVSAKGDAAILAFGTLVGAMGDEDRALVRSALEKIYNGAALNDKETTVMDGVAARLEGTGTGK